MDSDLTKEQAKYDTVWTQDSYADRSPGLRVLNESLEWLDPFPSASIIDLGSGSGQAAEEMSRRGYQVTGFDISVNANRCFNGLVFIGTLWDMPDIGQYDFGYCTDVMEHLPPNRVGGALSCIHQRVKNACFFQIARFEDHTDTKGHGNLHLTLRDPDWWAKAFRKTGWPRAEFVISDKYLLIKAYA